MWRWIATDISTNCSSAYNRSHHGRPYHSTADYSTAYYSAADHCTTYSDSYMHRLGHRVHQCHSMGWLAP